MPKKQLQGIIVSLGATETAKVKVVRQWQHPLYKKSVKRSKNYICHHDGMKLKLGDMVIIEECRPVSKTKHFRIIEKIKK
ncbi:30S ribosomal protein S17 [Patescibacteria group bacterium]|nr:30S ribosomal protein S17 [Patescibacteria group bacterium]MBU1966929.1 30S ribosomal protein S17 [Patescibacteria group bacterium]MBU2543723.1 30S ribosomal protein S17 [Patescibacteria group bacterium]